MFEAELLELDCELSSRPAPASPLRFPPSELAPRWCRGRGLLIGESLHNRFDNVTGLTVAAPDWADFAFFARSQYDLAGGYVRPNIWAEADDLPVPNESADFVLSSHVVEHLPDLVGALAEWHRVLRPGGVVYAVVPHRDALPADRDLPITELSHFVLDYWAHATADTHPGERRGHYHRFTKESLLELVEWAAADTPANFTVLHWADRDDRVGNGHVLVLGKP